MAIRYNMCDVEVSGNQAALLSALRRSHTTSYARCVAVQSQCMGQPWYANHVQEWCRDNSTLHLKPSLKSYVISPRAEVDDTRRDPKVVQGQVTSSRLACLSSKGCQARTQLQEPELASIHGLGCKDNKTLKFYTLSNDVSWHLAKSMGWRRLNSSPAFPMFAIVAAKDETVFACPPDSSLSHCVRTYHENSSGLARLKVTAVAADVSAQEQTDSVIQEITGDNFLETVMDKELNVVLLYHTRSCAFCTAASSAAASFHAVNRIVSGSGAARAKFVSVDAAHNDLPWEFTALSVPTVLFFPAESGNRSKSDTRVFPSAKPLTTSNLLNFVLANLSAQERSYLKSVHLNEKRRSDNKDIQNRAAGVSDSIKAREDL